MQVSLWRLAGGPLDPLLGIGAPLAGHEIGAAPPETRFPSSPHGTVRTIYARFDRSKKVVKRLVFICAFPLVGELLLRGY